jgi:hypothetical protein
MTIRKDVDITINEDVISGSVHFDVLDDNRLVKPLLTAIIVLAIREWLEKLKASNMDDYEIWEWRCIAIIPENEGDVREELKYSEMIVNENYRLIKPNNWLTFDQAIFILLGLNAIDFVPSIWGDFTLYGYEPRFEGDEELLENVFYNMPQFKFLSRSTFVEDGMITSNNLITFAIQEKLFTQAGVDYILNKKIKTNKDVETGIPLKRLEIYKSTLPKFLRKLKKPLSIRALTLHSDEQTDGEYTKAYKSELKVSGATIKKEIPKITKTLWWKNQSSEIQRKIKKK